MSLIIPGVEVQDLGEVGYGGERHGGADRLRLFVRCSRTRTKAALMDEFSAALQFPLYFTSDWDSFADCLGDLAWWPGDRDLEIVLVDTDQLLADDREARSVFLSIMEDLFGGTESPDSFIHLVSTPTPEGWS